ncbi:MAG: response regulator [Chitinophagales bacterium]
MISKKVLLVDDSPLIVERLMSMLQDLKIQSLFCCGTVFEAKQFLNHLIPDILVLDINLGDGSGIDLLEMAKIKRPETLVIMLTNQSGTYYRKLCKTLGADYFLDKSTDFEMVPEIISNS